MGEEQTFVLGGPGLPSGVASGIEVRAIPSSSPAGTRIELAVFSPSSNPLPAHEVASAFGGALGRIEWAAEGALPSEEAQVLSDLVSDLEQWLNDRGLR